MYLKSTTECFFITVVQQDVSNSFFKTRIKQSLNKMAPVVLQNMTYSFANGACYTVGPPSFPLQDPCQLCKYVPSITEILRKRAIKVVGPSDETAIKRPRVAASVAR